MKRSKSTKPTQLALSLYFCVFSVLMIACTSCVYSWSVKTEELIVIKTDFMN